MSTEVAGFKVLFICGEHPYPANNGMRIPTWNMIKNFSEFCDISIYSIDKLSSNSLEKKLTDIKNVKFLPREMSYDRSSHKIRSRLFRIIKFVLSKKPSFSIDHPSSAVLRDLEDIFLKDKFDIVILDSEFLAVYHSVLPSTSFNVISPNDSITLAWLNEIKYEIFSNPLIKLYKKANISRAKMFEMEQYNKFDLCHFVSDIDANFVREFVPKEKVIVVSNGVRPFSPDRIVKPSNNLDKVVIVGSLSGGNLIYTLRFIEEVWKNVHEKKPWMQLTLVSRITPDKYKKLFRKLNIRVSSFSGDLGAFYQDFGIVVSPVLKDCGILNKVLEGMVSGRPVFGYHCSFYGIPEAKPSRDYLSVDNPHDFIELLLNADEMAISLDRIGQSANQLALNKYNWKQKMNYLADELSYRQSVFRNK